MEKNDAIAIQLVNYGDGLLWDTDFISIDFGCTVEISKKHDLTELTNRWQALENLLGLFGAASASVAGTNGLVKGANVNQQEFLLRGDRTWQNPNVFAKKVDVDTAILNLSGGTPQVPNPPGNSPQPLTNANSVTLTGDQVIAGNKIFQGFTSLGNTGIKVDVFDFTAPTTANDYNIGWFSGGWHNIICLTGWLQSLETNEWDSSLSCPPNFYSLLKGYQNWWSVCLFSNDLTVNLHPDALQKLGNQPGKIMVVYIE